MPSYHPPPDYSPMCQNNHFFVIEARTLYNNLINPVMAEMRNQAGRITGKGIAQMKKHINNLSANIKRIFFAVFSISFLWVLYNVIFKSTQDFDPMLSLFLMLVFIVMFFLAYCLLRQINIPEKTGKIVLLIFVIVMGAMQIIIGLRLRFTPAFDLDAIFGGGRDWALTGSFINYQDYFEKFSNNLGGLFLYRCLFSLGRLLGINDFYSLALVYNTIMLQVMVYAVFDTTRRLAGMRAAILSLVMFGSFLPFYMMGAVFYTDLLSAPFAALCIYFFIRARKEGRLKQKTIYYILFGTFTAIGAVIKFTVIIIAIAAFIDLLLNIRWNKERLARRIFNTFTIPIASVFILISLLFVFYGYMNTQQNAEYVFKQRIPVTHWIMMGLNGSGYYTPVDYDFTMGLPDLATRKEEIPKVIQERINERGFTGMFKLYTEKAAADFGNGTYKLSDFLDDGPVNETPLHDLVLYDGRHQDAYKHIAQGAYLAFFLFMLVGGVLGVMRPGRFIVPLMAMFGLMLFLLIWETNARYTQNFMPVLILCAVLGVHVLSDRVFPRVKG